MTPKEFEQQIARIIETLSNPDRETQVTWNARIPDPDNPTQLRQIDIAIRRAEELTLVECRHRNSKEDVQWIEELHGRKQSLGAASIIAVSSVGFTRGAIAKAERLGVFLRILSEVTDPEILSWGSRTTVYVDFVQLRSIYIRLVMSDRIHIPTTPHALRTDTGNDFPLPAELARIARKLHTSSIPEGPITLQNTVNRVFLGMTPVNEMLISCDWRRLSREVPLPVVLAFEHLDLAGKRLDVVVERTHHSGTQIYQAPAGGVAIIDLGALPFEECCTLTGARATFSKSIALKGFGFIGPADRLELIHYKMEVISRNDPAYLRLLASESVDFLATPDSQERPGPPSTTVD